MELDIDYYILPSDGRDPNSDMTQEEIEYRGILQFFMDSIVKTIGTDSCKYNIDSYWDRLHLQLQDNDPNMLNNFYNEVMTAIISKYNLGIIDSEVGTVDKTFDKTDCIQFLDFFEKGKCCDFIINCYELNDYNIVLDDNTFVAFLDSEQIDTKNKYIINSYHSLLVKQFEYSSHFDRMELILNLVKRYKNEIISLIVETNNKKV